MAQAESHTITLVLRPPPDAPDDLPPGVVEVQALRYPEAVPAEPDPKNAQRISSALYVKRADPVAYWVPLTPKAAFDWYDQALGTRVHLRGRIRSRRDGDRHEVLWMGADLQPADGPAVRLQLLFRDEAQGTVVTYQAEVDAIPPRDPASFLPDDVVRVEVDYTFFNGPNGKTCRVVTDPADITRLVEAINGFQRSLGGISSGLPWPDGWADLVFIRRDGERIHVHVHPGSRSLSVADWPALQGTVWQLLEEIAAP